MAPACKDYTFPGDTAASSPTTPFVLTQSNGYRVEFPTTGSANVGTRATATGGSQMFGHVSGGVTGRHVDFTIEWDNGPRGHYTGDIDECGFARGFAVDEANPESRASWESTVPFKCVAQASQGSQLNGTFKVVIDNGPTVTWVIRQRAVPETHASHRYTKQKAVQTGLPMPS